MTRTQLSKSEFLTLAALLILAAFIRFHRLPELMPFISDQGNDYLSARQIIETKQLPLLGIQSSVPRFSQGPVYVWFLALVMAFTGFDPVYSALISAGFGLLAVGGVFLYAQKYIHKSVAFVAALVLAFSPLAVSQSRLAFHTNPIPIVSVVFLFLLVNYIKTEKYFFWLVFSFGLLFQFELVVAPLALLIIYGVWRAKPKISLRIITTGFLGLLLSLLPQVIYDLTHNFQQLGLFIVWVGYRLVSFIQPASEHTFSISKLYQLITLLLAYGQKFFSWWQVIPTLVIIIFSCIGIFQKRKRLKKQTIDLLLLWVAIMLMSFVAMGNVSEAYVPVLFIPISLLVGYGLMSFKPIFVRHMLLSFVLVVAFINMYFLVSQQYLIAQAESNTQNPFNTYGPPISDQLLIMQEIKQINQPVSLRSDDLGFTKFPSYLDNYVYLAHWLEVPLDAAEGLPVWINTTPTPHRANSYAVSAGKISVYIPEY